jgi:hypothetical protein
VDDLVRDAKARADWRKTACMAGDVLVLTRRRRRRTCG